MISTSPAHSLYPPGEDTEQALTLYHEKTAVWTYAHPHYKNTSSFTTIYGPRHLHVCCGHWQEYLPETVIPTAFVLFSGISYTSKNHRRTILV